MDDRIIARTLEILLDRSVIRRVPIEDWQVRVATYVAPGQYEDEGEWTDLDGYADFPALKTAFLRARAESPALSSPDGQMYLQFDFDGLEGLLSLDGLPYAGLGVNHTRVPAPGAGEHELEIEAMSLLRAYCQPELRASRSTFRGGAFLEVDREIEAACYDLAFAWEATQVIDDDRRKRRVAAALEEALLRVDLTLSHQELRADVERARGILAQGLGDVAPDPEGGRIYLVGHTHIDTAWLWPLSETVRKCGRTFATAARLMEAYPDYRFSCSQAQLYAYTREHYPSLYEEIQKWVREGRWRTTGGMWVESDCNVPSGESLIRQFLRGLAFYEREFGTRPRTCWLPDVFGYPGSLPQIIQGCGIPYFMTCKLHWQSTNPFPNHLFWWEGVDGSRVLAHIPRLRRYYNGYPNPEQLTFAWENFAQKGAYDEVMLPFGYGDGGGGVTMDMLEYAGRAASFPGLPATRMGDEERFFEDAEREAQALPVWVGELYLETHRGTYTSQSRTKRANRISERCLREAELWGSIAQSQGAEISFAPLADAWQRVLTQQFHDILPGSSIGQVYADAAADYERAQGTALQLRDAALAWLVEAQGATGDLGVYNGLSWTRNDPIEATIDNPGKPFCLVDADGQMCPVQIIDRNRDKVRVLFEPTGVPSIGLASYRVADGELEVSGPAAWKGGLENDCYRIELDGDGCITRLYDKRCDREVIPAGARANEWQLFQDGPEREAAWNVHDTFEKRQYPMTDPARITVVEQGPVRALVRVERPYRGSQFRCDIALYRQTPRIDFTCEVNWRERQTMLKVAFPVAVRSAHANYEIQFGAIQRPTHRNTSWEEQKFEVAAQRWADLSEAGYGVSLINDSRYGYDVKGNVLRLTLLRGPEYPDPEADLGGHKFAYALLPHMGDWTLGRTVQSAREFNEPMVSVPVSGGDAESLVAHAFLEVEGAGVIAETLKPAEDGDGWILRLYEAHGGRGKGRVRFDRPLERAFACNLVEEGNEQVELVQGTLAFAVCPFGIKTYRVHFGTGAGGTGSDVPRLSS